MRRMFVTIPLGNTVRWEEVVVGVVLGLVISLVLCAAGLTIPVLMPGLTIRLVPDNLLVSGLVFGLFAGREAGQMRGFLMRGLMRGSVGGSVGLLAGTLILGLVDGKEKLLVLGLAGSVGFFLGSGLFLGSSFARYVASMCLRGLAERLTVATSAARGLLSRAKGKPASQSVSLGFEATLEQAAKELAHKAQMLPEDQREATLLTAIDKLHEQAQTPEDVVRMARDLGRGMLDTALRAHLRQPDSFTRLWESVTVRLLGAGIAIATALTILTSLSQLLAGDLDAGRFIALAVLLVGAGLLGGVAAVGEVRRRQP